MTRLESSVKKITASRKTVYDFLSDMNNFGTLIPDSKAHTFEVDGDTCSFSVNGLGLVAVRLTEKDPEKLIRFESEKGFPFRVDLSIELGEPEDSLTEMKLILEADLNMMMKMMALKPLEEGMEIAASKLAGHLNNSRLR